jgi:hypothetical protein
MSKSDDDEIVENNDEIESISELRTQIDQLTKENQSLRQNMQFLSEKEVDKKQCLEEENLECAAQHSYGCNYASNHKHDSTCGRPGLYIRYCRRIPLLPKWIQSGNNSIF